MEMCKILGLRHKSMGFDHAFVNRRMLPILLSVLRHDSFDDYPWFFLYPFFAKHFPNTKFVLTVRSSTEAWYDSILRHEQIRGGAAIFGATYGLSSPSRFRKHYCNFYEAHNDRVRKYFQGDPRFIELCWESGDGWDAFCDFVGKPNPKTELPHANKGNYEFPAVNRS